MQNDDTKNANRRNELVIERIFMLEQLRRRPILLDVFAVDVSGPRLRHPEPAHADPTLNAAVLGI
jgi:hypothetical protein